MQAPFFALLIVLVFSSLKEPANINMLVTGTPGASTQTALATASKAFSELAASSPVLSS